MYQIQFRLGSASDPAGGAYSAAPDPLAGLRGLLLRGWEGTGREGRGRRQGEGEPRGGEGRGRDPINRPISGYAPGRKTASH